MPPTSRSQKAYSTIVWGCQMTYSTLWAHWNCWRTVSCLRTLWNWTDIVSAGIYCESHTALPQTPELSFIIITSRSSYLSPGITISLFSSDFSVAWQFCLRIQPAERSGARLSLSLSFALSSLSRVLSLSLFSHVPLYLSSVLSSLYLPYFFLFFLLFFFSLLKYTVIVQLDLQRGRPGWWRRS